MIEIKGHRSKVMNVKSCLVNDIWNKSYMNCGNEMKVKKWSSQWAQFMQLRKEAFFTHLHKLRLLRRSFLDFHFIFAVPIWFILYIINTHFFHGNIWTHNWPAPSVSGFSAQLVEHRTGNREVTGSNPVEVLNFFSGSLRNCINCVHCDDHFLTFKSCLVMLSSLYALVV